ncbi:2-dehydropantoate 2-reductase [Paenibacillus sp.]|uniref:ketopantoate reductase family protein n=1 Tax=Paenibacillus sp. TaxID=58172 RepID=UPI002D36ADE8|nr:2-dehydropantoate 2-reductase [Paenibacillus sp.]HZG86598.1 2-dehydropantoate 2-reductase [Paenibacillus sp.]
MRIDIVGAGSLGLLLAGRLAVVPAAKVRVVTRTREQAAALARDGVAVSELDGRERAAPVAGVGFGDAAETAGEANWTLFATKQTHWDEALVRFAALATASGSRLLLFQNGVGHRERLAAAGADPARLHVAVTTEGAAKTSARSVAHTGKGRTIVGGGDLEPLETFAALLREAGFEADVARDIERHVWRKLLVNSVINPLTAVLRVENGALPASPHFLQLMRSLHDEALAALPDLALEDPEEAWRQVLTVCEKTAANRSSMLQDVLAGRPTEIEFITGAVLRRAEASGAAAPTHAALYRMVKGIESR